MLPSMPACCILFLLWVWGLDVDTGLGVYHLPSQLMHCVCHKVLALLASQSFQTFAS